MKDKVSIGATVCWVLAGLCLAVSSWALTDAFAIRIGASDSMSSPEQMHLMTIKCASAIFYLVPAIALFKSNFEGLRSLIEHADAKIHAVMGTGSGFQDALKTRSALWDVQRQFRRCELDEAMYGGPAIPPELIEAVK